MMSITYPGSRANATSCKVCIGNGQMQDDGYITLANDDGREHRFLKRTCYYCGYTILFEPDVARQAPYSGGHTELFPNDIEEE